MRRNTETREQCGSCNHVKVIYHCSQCERPIEDEPPVTFFLNVNAYNASMDYIFCSPECFLKTYDGITTWIPGYVKHMVDE